MAGVWWGKLHEQLIKVGDVERKKMKKESNKKDKILFFLYKIQAQLVNLQTSFFFSKNLRGALPTDLQFQVFNDCMKCDIMTRILPNFVKFYEQILRYCRFVTFICLWKSTKQWGLWNFPLSLYAQHLCMGWGHTIWQKQQKQNKFLQITSGNHILSGKSH